jgi:hypothetical protein
MVNNGSLQRLMVCVLAFMSYAAAPAQVPHSIHMQAELNPLVQSVRDHGADTTALLVQVRQRYERSRDCSRASTGLYCDRSREVRVHCLLAEIG